MGRVGLFMPALLTEEGNQCWCHGSEESEMEAIFYTSLKLLKCDLFLRCYFQFCQLYVCVYKVATEEDMGPSLGAVSTSS